MQEEVIGKILSEIMQQQVLGNWKLYAVMFSLMFLSTVIGSYVSTYIGKRAETKATKADLDEILRQLKKTTETAEEIRTAISHADWATREWKSIRRTKLESLLESAIGARDWLIQQQRSCILFHEDNRQPSPSARVLQLAFLYFPELVNEAIDLAKVEGEANLWLIDTGIKIQEAGNDLTSKTAAQRAAIPLWAPYLRAMHMAVSAVEQKAPEIMKALWGVQSTISSE